uniref:Uncharacterized protein n=1 Tax=Lepeophtheirus salmonis TaxID=72036 RepID=A0A0K2VGM7_LEPSM
MEQALDSTCDKKTYSKALALGEYVSHIYFPQELILWPNHVSNLWQCRQEHCIVAGPYYHLGSQPEPTGGSEPSDFISCIKKYVDLDASLTFIAHFVDISLQFNMANFIYVCL